MQHIDGSTLSSLPQRVAYLKAFLDFSSADAAALHAAKPVVVPLIPQVLDAVYTKLLSFDITAASFVPRNTGFEGDREKSTHELTVDSPQIVIRKDFLKNYLVRLVTADYESDKTWEYMDQVAVMHTGLPGFKHREKRPELKVEYIHMGMLLGTVDIGLWWRTLKSVWMCRLCGRYPAIGGTGCWSGHWDKDGGDESV